jgi:hypothetical protein
MLKELKVLADHGKQFIGDLRSQPVSERFRGRPEISADITPGQTVAAEQSTWEDVFSAMSVH